MKILLIGVFSNSWSTNIHQTKALRRAGVRVEIFDARERLRLQDVTKVEEDLLSLARCWQPDLIFISKGRELKASVVVTLGKIAPTWLWYMDNVLGLSDDIITHMRNCTYASCGGLGVAEEASQRAAREVFYIPEGCDQFVFRPVSPHSDYECDVAIIGNEAESRTQITALLQSAGYRVKRYGRNQPDGFVFGNAYCMAVTGAKMIVDVPRVVEDTISERYYSDRLYQVLFCGGFLLMKYRKDVDKVFVEDVHLSIWRSEDELLGKIAFYLANPTVRRQITLNGMAYARSRFTWDIAMQQVLEYVEFKV